MVFSHTNAVILGRHAVQHVIDEFFALGLVAV